MSSSLLFYGFDMPKGPRGEKRPADVIGAAVMVTSGIGGDRPRFGEQYRLPFDYEPDQDDGTGL